MKAAGASGPAPRTLVIGVGNPLGGDDAIGPIVAERLEHAVGNTCTCIPFAGNGLDLLQKFAGQDTWERVFIIDAMKGDTLAVGEVALVDTSAVATGAYTSSHSVSILDTMDLAVRMGVDVPATIRFYAVGVVDVVPFREGLSPILSHKVDDVVATFIAELQQHDED